MLSKEVGDLALIGFIAGGKVKIGNNLFSTLKAKGEAELNKEFNFGAKADINIYSDAKDISNYAMDAMELFVGSELVKGNQDFLNPLSNATRAETAVFLFRLYKRGQ